LSAGDISLGLIIGIVVVVLLIVIVFVGALTFYVVRKRRASQSSSFSTKPVDVPLYPMPTPEGRVYAPISDVTNSGAIPKDYATFDANLSHNSNPNPDLKYAVFSANANPDLNATTLNDLLLHFEIPFAELIIGEMLGAGNFGKVFLVTYLGHLLACKQLTPKNSEQPTSFSQALKKRSKDVEEFISEAKVLSQIPPSPYVVRLTGLCRDPFCILTEYLNGGSLSNHLKRTDISLPTGVCLTFLKQICMGINHLHKNGIIHRDLAARNILLRVDAKNPSAIPVCVLADMGLSRLYDREGEYQQTKSATLPLKWSAPGLFVLFYFLIV
jgi:tRNA A-37 threonylcarbamoyl transferase component Bud32